jgi:GT2 family glycosyltransferase
MIATDNDVSTSSISSILVAVVLYKCSFAESRALSSLLNLLGEESSLAKHFSVVVCDNSPQPQKPGSDLPFPIFYVHDPSNGGLAPAYNFALARAESQGLEWLLLFDQDTLVTRDFLVELAALTLTLRDEARVAAIVPKLLVNGIVYSPATHFIDVLRKQFLAPRPNSYSSLKGIQEDRLNVYNSASTLRVSAVRSIGAFPEEFWLDYLDHTVFHTLFVRGYRIYVMNASLEHHQSDADLKDVSAARHRNVLKAQALYVKRTGNFVDRLLYRIWLLRYSRKLRSLCKDKRVWRTTALQAFRMRVADSAASSETRRNISIS